jgi:hypothetical protein
MRTEEYWWAIRHAQRVRAPLAHLWSAKMMRAAASESINRDVPAKDMQIPISVPMTHAALEGHVLAIITAERDDAVADDAATIETETRQHPS